MLPQSWKNHRVIYCFHYSERWIKILSGLKFPVSNRQKKPCLRQQQHDATGACLYSKVMGSEEPKATLCALGVCSSLLPWLHTHHTGVHQVLISQLVFQKVVYVGPVRPSPSLDQCPASGDKRICFQNPSIQMYPATRINPKQQSGCRSSAGII